LGGGCCHRLALRVLPFGPSKTPPGDESVAGRANILVFPDLNAGNIAYKCVQRFAKADAFGPFFLGLKKTASDLSRGASVADIVGVLTAASVRAEGSPGACGVGDREPGSSALPGT
jgi:hypothetical protein